MGSWLSAATIVKGSGKCEACQPGSAPMEDASVRRLASSTHPAMPCSVLPTDTLPRLLTPCSACARTNFDWHHRRCASLSAQSVYRANCPSAASNPIVVADLRAGQGCADCVGEQYGTDGLTCQACEPGKHPHIDHTSCDDCSPVRPRQASAPDSPGNAPQIVAGWAGEGRRHGHVQKVQARQDAGGRQAVLHQVWRSVPQTRRARCAQRFCAHRAICCG